MTPTSVDVLLFQLGSHRLAVELQLVSSVLASHEAEGMFHLDLRPFLVAADDDPSQLDELGQDGRVGLVELDGPPTVVLLGEVLGAESLDASDLLPIPDWVAGWMPQVYLSACAIVDDKVVWLVDLDTLNRTSPP